jgi:hypothetical protein
MGISPYRMFLRGIRSGSNRSTVGEFRVASEQIFGRRSINGTVLVVLYNHATM